MSTAFPSLRLAGIFALALLAAPFAPAQELAKAAPEPAKTAPLSNATIFIVRHAEKPEHGEGLSPEGEKRAQFYVDYFKGLKVEGKPLKLDHLFAAADSKNSERSRLTLTPLSRALNLPLDLRFETEDAKKLAEELQSKDHGKSILICWHHGDIPDLMKKLGEKPAKLLPGGEWPDDVFDWLIVLRFDADGDVIPSRCYRIKERWGKARP